MEASGWTPPPPLPRRVLNFKPPSPLHPTPPFVEIRSSVGPEPSAYGRTRTVEAVRSSGPASAISYTNYASPENPSTLHQQIHQARTPAGANTAHPATLCFYDHLQRLALTMLAPGPDPTPTAPSNRSGLQTGGYNRPSTPQQPSTSTFRGPSDHGSQAKREQPHVTIQVYIKSPNPAFRSEDGLRNIDLWCRQLQCSTAFRHLRNQLSKHCSSSAFSPTVRVEAYEALPDYKDIINHSLNEREYRGLQECYEHIERFLQYTKKMSSKPGFTMPDHVIAKGKASLANMKFIRDQMEDIRNGDGGKNRRRRAALREQLAPAFDDGRGPDRDQSRNTFGSDRLNRQSQASAGQTMPAACAWPGAAASPLVYPNKGQSPSPQQLNHLPGQNQSNTKPQAMHSISPSPLDPRLRQRAAMAQDQRQHHPRKPNAPPQEAPQRGENRKSSAAVQAGSDLMPPPLTPAQCYPRPGPPRPGSVAKPFDFAPFPLLVKSIYRGITQPYHNVALVIDSSVWATTAGIGVLRFGYEPDWASRESIQRSGACLERVSMTKGTGRRWLGDALVECFVGDGTEKIPAWLEGDGEGAGVVWPGGEGETTDHDLGMMSGTGVGGLSGETTRMLKKLSVPGTENVDFMDREWCGLL